MRLRLVAPIALALFACASARPTADTTNVADGRNAARPTLASNAGGPNARGKYTCDYEEDTGSHLRQKVCRYVDSENDARGQVQDAVREWQAHPIAGAPGSGGH
jgi:hypothetical protein